MVHFRDKNTLSSEKSKKHSIPKVFPVENTEIMRIPKDLADPGMPSDFLFPSWVHPPNS